MRKWLTFLMTLLVGASASYVNAAANNSEVNFEAGYRQDNLSWKYKIPASFPLLETSRRFKDLDIFQIGVNAKTWLACNFYARASADFGWVLDGNFRESISLRAISGSSIEEFGANYSHNDVVDDRYVYDLNIAVGYPFYFCNCSMSVAPVVGYAFNEQNLRLRRNDTFFGGDDSSPFIGSGDNCCEHKFVNRWYGPFIGIDFDYRPCGECWNLYAAFEYHWAFFKGRSNFGDGFDCENSRHSDDGHGIVFNIGAEYQFCECWLVGLDVKFQDFGASRNKHLDISDSELDVSLHKERTNNKWRSYAVSLTFGRDF